MLEVYPWLHIKQEVTNQRETKARNWHHCQFQGGWVWRRSWSWTGNSDIWCQQPQGCCLSIPQQNQFLMAIQHQNFALSLLDHTFLVLMDQKLFTMQDPIMAIQGGDKSCTLASWAYLVGENWVTISWW